MKTNEWIKTGESENGMLDIFVKGETLDGDRYLKVQYKDKEGNKVGTQEQIPVKRIQLLSALLDSINMEYGNGW